MSARAGEICPSLLINTHPSTSLYTLLSLFIIPNLFIIILANRGNRWCFIFVFNVLSEGGFQGDNQSPTTRWPDCCHPKPAARPFSVSPPLVLSAKELPREREEKANFFKKGKNILKHLIATRMPYVHLLWEPSTMWLPFRKYGVRLWRRVRFWRGARVVTRMTLNTLRTRSNSLLMCFGVSFHGHGIVALTSAFEHSVHQLQWNSRPLETVCLFEKSEDFKGPWLQVAPFHPHTTLADWCFFF